MSSVKPISPISWDNLGSAPLRPKQPSAAQRWQEDYSSHFLHTTLHFKAFQKGEGRGPAAPAPMHKDKAPAWMTLIATLTRSNLWTCHNPRRTPQGTAFLQQTRSDHLCSHRSENLEMWLKYGQHPMSKGMNELHFMLDIQTFWLLK